MSSDLERLIHLEAERRHIAWRIGELERRMDRQENKPDVVTRALGPGGWIKIIAGLCLLLITLWSTGGDINAALKAAKAGAGG